MKCPFCKSKNTEKISGSTVLTQRYICLDCGFVFEKLDESDLKRYKEA